MQRLVPVLLLLVAAWCGAASAEEKAPEWPKPVSQLEQVKALDPATEAVYLGYRTGLVKALASRCPKLERLALRSDSTIQVDDVQALRKLTALQELVLVGDMGFPKSHFEVVGKLSSLRSLRIGLP